MTKGARGTVVAARTVVLSSATWTAELSAELVRLGFAPEAADEGAVRALQHIGRAGWPREVLRVDHQPETSRATRALMEPPTRRGSPDG